jgi:DNA-binding NtrC family response regulator
LEKKHILVVDDEEALLTTYRLILEMQGYSSSEARNTAEAKAILHSRKIDLLLCDLTLGNGESGTAIIEYARSISPDIPAALLSGYNTQDHAEWASQNDVMLLQKPLPIHSLLRAVSQLLDAGSQRRKTA